MQFIAENQRTIIRPDGRDQVVRWNYWTKRDFYPIRHWPDQLVRIALSQPDNRTRYYLYVFLTGNGVAPRTAVRWIEGAYPDLDNSARNHLKWLADSNSRIWEHYNITYFDMQTGKYEHR